MADRFYREAVLKRRDIKPCGLCGKGVLHTGAPLAYRIRIETFAFDLREIQKESGLEQVFGGGSAGAVLASVMGPDPVLARPVGDPITTLVCLDCAMQETHQIPALIERASERKDDEESDG